MTSKELNKHYEKAKTEYLAEIQNDDGSYTCWGCFDRFLIIEIHHIIKRSQSKYYYADERNFIELCHECHQKAEGTIEQQKTLNCYEGIAIVKHDLLIEYSKLELYEQTLLFKYGK